MGMNERLDAALHELSAIRIEIERARHHEDIPTLSRLTERRAELRAELKAIEEQDPSVERRILIHELEGLQRQVSVPPPNLGLSLATTAMDGGGGSASAGFEHGKYNREAANDNTGGMRSHNDALARIAWIAQRLSELDAIRP